MRLFIFGIGYSAQALLAEHAGRFSHIAGTVRTAEKAAPLRALGVEALVHGGGTPSAEVAAALRESDALLASAAPGDAGDPLLADFDQALRSASRLRQIIYLSTVGVYGDHGGRWIDETAPLEATSPRGRRRVEAEAAWLELGNRTDASVQCHRLAGIYGPGRNAIDDLREGTARRIVKPGQVFNRIHVADIAGAIAAGFAAPHVTGGINVCDSEPAPPQDVVAFAASLIDVAPPPETPFETATLSEMARSFYAENKRCSNRRLREDLGYRMRYPTYREGLAALAGR
jgi:nucleoside-diphosphate-sugar epimerase